MPLPKGYRYARCRRGHPFNAANTYVRPDTGRQNCRICARERQRERRAAAKCPRCYGTGRVLLRDTDGRFGNSLVPCPLCGSREAGAPQP